MSDQQKPEVLSGPERLMQSIFRAMGINPQEIQANVQRVITDIQNGLTHLQSTMDSVDERLKNIEARLEIRNGKDNNPKAIQQEARHAEE